MIFFCSFLELCSNPHLVVLCSNIERGVTVPIVNVDIEAYIAPKKLSDKFLVAIVCRIMESGVTDFFSCIGVFFQAQDDSFLPFGRVGSTLSLDVGTETE